MEQRDVVLQAHERADRHAGADRVGEADVEAGDERPPDQQKEQDERWSKKEPGGPPISAKHRFRALPEAGPGLLDERRAGNVSFGSQGFASLPINPRPVAIPSASAGVPRHG